MINRKIVCYSCCTGGYDDILQHNVINKDYDYIFFTDNKDLIQKKQIGQWRIRPLVYKKSTNVKNARWHKVNAHLLFPEYEYSLWCDANIIINNEIIYNKINEFIKNGIDFSVPLHPERKCIYEEGEEIKRRQYDSIKTVDAEMNFLKNNNYPVNNGLHETCILFRRHNAIKEMLNCWWKMIKKYSKRDQLSFDYALWKNNTIVHPLYPNGKDHRENGDFTFLYGQNHNSKQKELKCTWLVSKIIKLFYECEENKVKYRFCGIPLFSIKNNNDKQVVKILGVKFSYKKIGTHKMHINFKNYDKE